MSIVKTVVHTFTGGHWGIKMRCRVRSQPARTRDITILMKVLGASRAAAYLPNCAHTLLHVVPPLSRSLFLPLSWIFLNGCLRCSLSFLSYLHPAAFHWAEVPSRHKIVADIPRPWLIIVEWRPQPCRLLSPCLGLCWGIRFLPGQSQSPEIPSLSAGKDTIRWGRAWNWDDGGKKK